MRHSIVFTQKELDLFNTGKALSAWKAVVLRLETQLQQARNNVARELREANRA